MIKLMIVDDHHLVCEGIAQLLSGLPDVKVIEKTYSGEDAIKLAKEKKPDVILMDIKMPGIDGIQATHKILAQDPNIKVIALSSCSNEPFPSSILKAGAKGYLTKGVNLDKMAQAIRCVVKGNSYLEPEIAQQLALKSIPGGTAIPLESLSNRELSVTMMIVNGITLQEIAEKFHISPKTVSTYRYRIYEKLKVKTDVELTLFAMRNGILDSEHKETR